MSEIGPTPSAEQADDVPQWALAEADKRLASPHGSRWHLAELIAAHETPPVDEAEALWLHLCDVAGRNLRDNGDHLEPDHLEPIEYLRAHLAKVRREAAELYDELLRADQGPEQCKAIIRDKLAKVRGERASDAHSGPHSAKTQI